MGFRIWPGTYDLIAGQALQEIEDLRRASMTVGGLLQQTEFCYGRAEAHSDVSAKTPVPPDRTTYDPGADTCVAVPSAAGGTVDPPVGWELIRQWRQAAWPDGDPDRLATAADAWAAAGKTLSGASSLVDDGVAVVGAQESPEVEPATVVCYELGTGLEQVAAACAAIGASCRSQAAAVRNAHKELIEQVAEALVISAAIQSVGALFVPETLGTDELLVQGIQAAEIANVVDRVKAALAVLARAAETAAAELQATRIEASTEVFRSILARSPVIAGTKNVTSAGEAAATVALQDAGHGSVWGLKPFLRSDVLEKVLGANLPHNFPTIDRWTYEKLTANGVTTRVDTATSIKTIDLDARTYQDTAKLKSTITGYLNKLEHFNGGRIDETRIVGEQMTDRVLEVGASRTASPEQQAMIDELSKIATQKGIILDWKALP